MTTYKCKACGGHWAEGVTRDHQEDQECRACAVERVNLLTVFYKSAMDRSECLERMAKDLSGELEAEVVETDALRKRLVDASRTIHNLGPSFTPPQSHGASSRRCWTPRRGNGTPSAPVSRNWRRRDARC